MIYVKEYPLHLFQPFCPFQTVRDIVHFLRNGEKTSAKSDEDEAAGCASLEHLYLFNPSVINTFKEKLFGNNYLGLSPMFLFCVAGLK